MQHCVELLLGEYHIIECSSLQPPAVG